MSANICISSSNIELQKSLKMKKIELKVNIKCHKCRTQVLKAVTKVSGVDHVCANVDKEVVTIIGDVDPVLVTSKVRKAGKRAEIISVGPAKKEN